MVKIMSQEWEPVKGEIMTRWGNDVNPESPLPEYPRPQLERKEWLNLNGLWNYAIRPKSRKRVDSYDGKILVPFAVESALSGVKKKTLAKAKTMVSASFLNSERLEWKKDYIAFWSCRLGGIRMGK